MSNGSGKLGGPANILLESHEDRLQSVETALRENTAETVACKTGIASLSQQLVESNASLAQRMESGFTRVFERMDTHTAQAAVISQQVDSIGKTVGVQGVDLVQLKGQEKVRRDRKKSLMKIGWILVLPVTGYIAKAVTDALWVVLTHR